MSSKFGISIKSKTSFNIEEVLIELISIENTVDIYDFALIFELNKLLNKLKIIDKELYNLDSFSKINKFLGFAIK